MTLEYMIHLALLGGFCAPLASTLILAITIIYFRSISEFAISKIVQASFLLYFLCSSLAGFGWFFLGSRPIKWDLVLFKVSKTHAVSVSLYLDVAGAVLLITTALIANVIIFYSRRYLHRDPGYARFFTCISLFTFGMTMILCSGSFNLLFAGWEIVGFSSFLLIGYYWHRQKAIVNSNQAYYIYRIFDLGLLACALISHMIWHTDDLFFELSSGSLLEGWIHAPLWQQWLLSAVILLPVIGKSAQFPVSFWLPKAMEGPTPSSAIFYGSLSIHAGVFLLIRTYSIWYNTPGFVFVIGGLGCLTAIFAGLFCRTQASIKGQIGYASITQVGLMLIELAFGLPTLALFHLVGNALLRCFQLLISPSILTQQLEIQSALQGEVLLNQWAIENWLPKWLDSTLYVFSLNEGYFEPILKRWLAEPIQRLANAMNLMYSKVIQVLFLKPRKKFWKASISSGLSLQSVIFIPCAALLLSLLSFLIEDYQHSGHILISLTLFFSFVALGEFQYSKRLLNLVVLSNAFAAVSLWVEHPSHEPNIFMYLIGLFVSWYVALDALSYVLRKRNVPSLRTYHGLFGQFPLASGMCLLGILGIIGFPIGSTFFSEDLLLSYAIEQGWPFLLVFTAIFLLNGISLIRMYSRLFWGAANNYSAEIQLDFSKAKTTFLLVCFCVGNFLALYVTNGFALL